MAEADVHAPSMGGREMNGAIRMRPVVVCGRCLCQVVLDADDVCGAAAPATRAGWRKDGRCWLCPLCLAARDGLGTPAHIKERVTEEVSAMSNDELALLHGAVVAEIRSRNRP